MIMLNFRLRFTSSQRRTFELLAYMLILSAGCIAGTLFMLRGIAPRIQFYHIFRPHTTRAGISFGHKSACD